MKWFALLVLALAVARGEAVKIQPGKVRGTWEAWGCSLCWWANVFGDRDDLADLFFTTKQVTLDGTELPGLGMNYARYNAGACSPAEIDGRRMQVSKIILPYRQMEGFWLDGRDSDPESASWDWSVDENQRAMLTKARDRGAEFFELFSNAPMWWMCRNDNPSGAEVATEDNLRRDQERNFAIYLATIAKRAKERWGINFDTVEPFNEPVSRWWFADCKQEGCHFSRPAQARLLPLLREELDRRGLQDTALAASDENTYDEAVGTWRSFSPEIRGIVPQINVHGYQEAGGDRAQLRELAEKDGKKLWLTEYGEGDPSGLRMARNLHLDFHRLQPTAWAYWQPIDGSGWGLISADMRRGRLGRVNRKFHVMAQYSRHIRPGMEILGSGAEEVVAALDRRGRKLVVVIFNDGPERTLRLDLSACGAAGATVTRWVTATRWRGPAYEMRRDLAVAAGGIECPLPADSVQTLEVGPLDGEFLKIPAATR